MTVIFPHVNPSTPRRAEGWAGSTSVVTQMDREVEAQ